MIPSDPARRKRNVLLVFETRYPEARTILGGIANYGKSSGDWSVFLDDEAEAERNPALLSGRHWDGAISLHTTEPFAAECRRLGIPLVDLNDRPALPGVHQIRPDNLAIGRMGAGHFIERGFHNFAYCGYSNQDWSVERRRGFVESVGRAGFIVHLHEPSGPCLREGLEGGKDLMLEIAMWLAKCPLPLAVMACHDLLAVQVMQACESIGVLVPEEAAILGVEDDPIRCEFSHRPLSSVATNGLVSGYAAAELLDRLMCGETSAPVRTRTEPTRVLTRHSTEITAIEDSSVASALRYIRDNACMGISVADVVGHVGTSRSQLERQFRRYIGRSPQAEIREMRISRAKQLLLETDFPLRKIAGLVGFEHAEYLSVFFKRSTSHSPGAYRRHVRIRTDQRPPMPGRPRVFSASPGPDRNGHRFERAGDAPASGEWLDTTAPDPRVLRVVGG